MTSATIPAHRVVRELRFRLENSDHLRRFSPRAIWPGSFARSGRVDFPAGFQVAVVSTTATNSH